MILCWQISVLCLNETQQSIRCPTCCFLYHTQRYILKFICEASFSSLKKNVADGALGAPRNYCEQTEAIHTTTHKQRAQDRPAEAVVLSIIQVVIVC